MRRVLITRLTAMGDVAMTAPIVAAACKANPDILFDVLSTPFFQPFFEPLPNLRFIGTDIRKQKNGLIALWRLFQDLRHGRMPGALSPDGSSYDVVLDLHDVLRTKVLRTLFRLTGAAVYSIDKGRAEKKRLTSGKSHAQLKPMTSRYADVFRQAGFSIPDGLNIRPAEPLPAAFSHMVKGDDLWVGISPFAQHKGKMYPIDKMASVIDILLSNPSVHVFLFGGGKQEKEQAEALAKGRERCSVMIGVMKLAEEMAFMSNLDVMLSMDSSAMHVSSLFGVRVVSVWGATHPYAGFLGYGQSLSDCVQRDDLDCRPCSVFGNKPCRFADYRCFDIDPQKIADRILAKG